MYSGGTFNSLCYSLYNQIYICLNPFVLFLSQVRAHQLVLPPCEVVIKAVSEYVSSIKDLGNLDAIARDVFKQSQVGHVHVPHPPTPPQKCKRKMIATLV